MKVTEVSYGVRLSKNYNSKGVDMTATLDEGDTVEEAMAELKKLVRKELGLDNG